jgi:hypothetical protein
VEDKAPQIATQVANLTQPQPPSHKPTKKKNESMYIATETSKKEPYYKVGKSEQMQDYVVLRF